MSVLSPVVVRAFFETLYSAYMHPQYWSSPTVTFLSLVESAFKRRSGPAAPTGLAFWPFITRRWALGAVLPVHA